WTFPSTYQEKVLGVSYLSVGFSQCIGRHCRHRPEQGDPDAPLPGHFHQLLRGDTKTFPSQPRDIISPALEEAKVASYVGLHNFFSGLCADMVPPLTAASYAAKFGNLWVRLRYTGDGEAPSRDYVAEELILLTTWINAHGIYSFIALPNKRDVELCFCHESTLRCFLEVVSSKCNEAKWKVSIPCNVELYLKRYCDILQPAVKPVDKFGLWFGVRKYKVRMRKDGSGHLIQIPYNGRIIYPGQVTKCFICQSCWRCGNLGHKARECQYESECSLCSHRGHTFFNCPMSYSNKAKSAKHPTTQPGH
uniref:CCHC-type domain-containing protein n=1 Tax=Mola mola TaxID=94237 RepID=A0A3Q3WU03_MOLML